MKFNLATFLLATPSLVQGTLRGAERELERELRVSRDNSYNEKLGQCVGATCGIWGDPHIITCDGLGYDCQGLGLFTMMKNHMYNIQANFVNVGQEEHDLIKSWGVTEGASLANDIIIDFLGNDAPVLQFGFGDLNKHDGTFPSEEGCTPWNYYHPINMPGTGRTVEKTIPDCRKRCEDTNGCTKFSWWQDGGCYLNNDDATLKPAPSRWSRMITGSLDSECGKPHELPKLAVKEERLFHGQIGRRCPLLMHVDGVLQDISDFYTKRDGTILEGDGYSVKKVWGHRIHIEYTLSSGDVAEIQLPVMGDGPGELWSCHWDLLVCLPGSEKDTFQAGGLGLLGTPNGNTQDDWMTPTGETLPLKLGSNRFKDSIDYCYDNWCVSQADSLMAYTGGQTYKDVKCEKQPYVTFDVHNPHCKLSADKIIAACEKEPVLMRHACEVDCCNGGCRDTDDEIKEIAKVKKLSEDPDDIQYDVPSHNDCSDNGFLGTGDLVCTGANGDPIVKLIHSSGSIPLPDNSVVIYGIELDVEPHDGVAGKSVKFKVNNPFVDTADVYVKHDKSVFTTFLAPECDSMTQTPSGCDTKAKTIEVACHDYNGKIAPYALVSVYFSSNDIPSSDASVDKCCHASDPDAGVVKYTFEVTCECPSDAVA